MLQASDFTVNEAWIAFKVNRQPIVLKEAFINAYALIDAGSTYVIGVFTIESSNRFPSLEEVEAVFQSALKTKGFTWPKSLIIPRDHTEDNTFKIAAEKRQIQVKNFPMQDVESIAKDFIDGFNKDFLRTLS
jgi:hypothetical protein